MNVTSVGGLVLRGEELLVVRMTYGPTAGRYMIPGGILDPGETLDVAVAREVHEETNIIARPVGIAGVRTRVSRRGTDTYVIWLLDHMEGEPVPDGREVDDARFLPLSEIATRNDISYLVQYLAARIAAGTIRPSPIVDDYDYQLPGTTPDTWKLFL